VAVERVETSVRECEASGQKKNKKYIASWRRTLTQKKTDEVFNRAN